MGAAASSRNAASADQDSKIAFDDDDDNDEEINRDFARQLEAKRRQQKLKGGFLGMGKGETGKNGQKGSKKPPKVIGLIDSDDEEEAKRNNHDEERDQIQELDELNRTFGSFGLASEAKKDRGKKPQTVEEEGAMSPENTFLTSSMSHTRFPPGTSLGRKGSLQHQRGGPPPPTNATSKAIKFSWDEKNMPPNRESEEWTYKKTVIEGFDPDKFRRANRGLGESPSMFASSGSSTIRPPPPPPAAISASSPVPTYDSSEMQMLASIERELGVI